MSARHDSPSPLDLTRTLGWQTRVDPVDAFDQTIDVEVAAEDRYTERAELGAGGMGTVTLAHDARIGRDVAIKRLHEVHASSPELLARFVREARVQGQLEHPAIVPVYDIERRSDGTTFFTMRRVGGRTLHDIIVGLARGETTHTVRELLTAFSTVCLAVDYAHSRGVVHRDLKPANVMLGDFGEVYVLDWGLALLHGEAEPREERLSMPGQFLGTPLYVAPEQMTDPSVGPAADVFSLGAILFEILTWIPLRSTDAIFMPAEARMAIRAPTRGVDPELEAICITATQTEPHERYRSARELHDALVKYLEGDRDRARRRELAAMHADRGRLALVAHDGGGWMRELSRAIALDPENRDYVTLLATTLATPPREVPPEVEAQMTRETQQVVRHGALFSVLGMASWFLFLPIVLAIGVADVTQLGALIGAMLLALLVSVIAWRRQGDIGGTLQVCVLVATLLAEVMLSRMYGPLIMMPTMVISYTILVQSHPWRTFGRIGFVLGMLALVIPLVLELVGIVRPTYEIAGGNLVVHAQALELSGRGALLLLAGVHLLVLILPCAFIAKMRADLTKMQREQHLRSWQFRRLGAELVQ